MADTNLPSRPVLPGEDEKNLTLREYEQRHADLKLHMAEMFARERELRETITDKLEEARALQAVEVLRRLDELNHAHKIALENWARSLPRELFDQWKDEHDKWRRSIDAAVLVMTPNALSIAQLNARLDALESMASSINGALALIRWTGMAGVLALILSLARLVGVLP